MSLTKKNPVVDVLLYGALGIVMAAGLIVPLYLYGSFIWDKEGGQQAIVLIVACIINTLVQMATRKRRKETQGDGSAEEL